MQHLLLKKSPPCSEPTSLQFFLSLAFLRLVSRAISTLVGQEEAAEWLLPIAIGVRGVCCNGYLTACIQSLVVGG